LGVPVSTVTFPGVCVVVPPPETADVVGVGAGVVVEPVPVVGVVEPAAASCCMIVRGGVVLVVVGVLVVAGWGLVAGGVVLVAGCCELEFELGACVEAGVVAPDVDALALLLLPLPPHPASAATRASVAMLAILTLVTPLPLRLSFSRRGGFTAPLASAGTIANFPGRFVGGSRHISRVCLDMTVVDRQSFVTLFWTCLPRFGLRASTRRVVRKTLESNATFL
jgi:hypothetical protein